MQPQGGGAWAAAGQKGDPGGAIRGAGASSTEQYPATVFPEPKGHRQKQSASAGYLGQSRSSHGNGLQPLGEYDGEQPESKPFMDRMQSLFMKSSDAKQTPALHAVGGNQQQTGTLADRVAFDPFLQGKTSSRGSTRDAVDRVYRERVLVRVYDLGKTAVMRGFNQMSKSYGAFHSGVEVYGREWSFGMTFDEWSTGITWNPPAENPDHRYRETLSMGYTSLAPTQVWHAIEEMKSEWRGCTYHLLTKNCHHFTNKLCEKLGVGRTPPWLNDLAGTGAATVDFLDSADSGYDGGEALIDFVAGIKSGLWNTLTLNWSRDEASSLPVPGPGHAASARAPLRDQRGELAQDEHGRNPFAVLRQ